MVIKLSGRVRSQREEKLLQRIIETEGIKKIQDAIDILDKVTRELGKVTVKDIEKVVNVSKYLSPTSLGVGGTATIWTPASGKAIRAKRIQGSVDAKTRIDLRWGTTAFETYYLPADGSFMANLVGCNEQPATDVSLTIRSSAAAIVTASAKGDEV